jgi:hypothetical protein
MVFTHAGGADADEVGGFVQLGNGCDAALLKV